MYMHMYMSTHMYTQMHTCMYPYPVRVISLHGRWSPGLLLGALAVYP